LIKGDILNIFDYTIPKEGEEFATLFQDKDIKISRIVSSDKLEKKLYIQDKDEFVVVLEGEAQLDIDGKIVNLRKGEYIFIKAKTPHYMLWSASGTLWLAIYF